MENFLSTLDITDRGLIALLESTIHKCDLAPDGFLTEGLPLRTWVFVEKGFLKQLQSYKNIIDTEKFYPDGTSMLLMGVSTGPDAANCYCVQAIEPSTLYYLLPEELNEICNRYPSLSMAYMQQIGSAAANMRMTNDIWFLPASQRFEYIKTKHPWLLRAGPGPLADYFRLTGKDYSALRAYFN